MELIQYEKKTSIGSLYLVASYDGLYGLYFKPRPLPVLSTIPLGTPTKKFLSQAAHQLDEYFAGKRKAFDIELKVTGTDFQLHVWQQLRNIPYGKTVAYSDIAKRIKNPKAVRAVGSANGKNPFCIIIPCHRVIAADGSIGGYAGGVVVKRKLLEIERKGRLNSSTDTPF